MPHKNVLIMIGHSIQCKLTAPSPVIKLDSTLTFSSVRFLLSVFAAAKAILSSRPVLTKDNSRT